MAYDISQFNADNVVHFQAEWLVKMFGDELRPAFEDITRSAMRLAFQRKPEYTGWGFWNNLWDGKGEKRTDTEFSFMNYHEAENRLDEYNRISGKADSVMNCIPEACRPELFQLLYYPVKGAALMNRMNLGGQLYRQYAREGRSDAAVVRGDVSACLDSLKLITEEYNNMLGGGQQTGASNPKQQEIKTFFIAFCFLP